MSRITNNSVGVMLVALVGVALAPALSSGQGSALLPPNANFQGKSLAEWSVLASAHAIEEGLGGQSLPDTVGRVRFLPFSFEDTDAQFHVDLDAGTAITFPTLFIFGELYDDGTQDNPADPIVDVFFETTSVEARLDGRVLLQGVAAELGEYRFGPIPFDQPILYAEPQPRGPALHSVAALFVLGIGSVYHPLPVGEHTLVITMDSLFFGFRQTTYQITVTPPGRR
jgi:hypothetical protein